MFRQRVCRQSWRARAMTIASACVVRLGTLRRDSAALRAPASRDGRVVDGGGLDRFGTRHRSGYARMYNPWIESKGIQPDDPTVTSQSEIEERHKRRNNLVFMSQSGYNYDRKREEDEGSDWGNSTSQFHHA